MGLLNTNSYVEGHVHVHKVKSIQFDKVAFRLKHTHTPIDQIHVTQTHAATDSGHKVQYENWGGQKFMSRERIPESSVNKLN